MQIMLYYAHQQFGPKLAANYHKITALKVVSHVKSCKSYWNAENLFFYSDKHSCPLRQTSETYHLTERFSGRPCVLNGNVRVVK